MAKFPGEKLRRELKHKEQILQRQGQRLTGGESQCTKVIVMKNLSEKKREP
jgi:hypothetical protein